MTRGVCRWPGPAVIRGRLCIHRKRNNCLYVCGGLPFGVSKVAVRRILENDIVRPIRPAGHERASILKHSLDAPDQ